MKQTNKFIVISALYTIILLASTVPAGKLISAEQPPFAQWITMGTETGYRVDEAALSPSGELWLTGAVDWQSVTDPARPGGGPYAAYTEAWLRLDLNGRVMSTNKLVGVTDGHILFDTDGNRYLTGNFDSIGYWSGWITSTNYLFDPAQVHGFFLAKYGPDDQLVWVRSQALADNATVSSRGRVITLDADGNLVVGINSDGEMTLGNVQLGAGTGPVIAKYDRNGQMLWAKRIASAGGLNDLRVDPTGHFILCGFLPEGVMDFDGTTLDPGSTGLSYNGDFYLARLNPAGDLDWVKLGYASSLAVAKSGEIYTAFWWSKDVVAYGLAKFSPGGDLLWSKSFYDGVAVYGVALDRDDEPVFTGAISSTARFDDITLIPRTTGWEDILLAQTDTAGNFRWAMSGGGAEFDRGQQVICDQAGNIFLVGDSRKNNGTFDGLPLTPLPVLTQFAAELNPAPKLKIAFNGGTPVLSWPARATNYVLEAANSLPAVSWNFVTNTPTISGRDSSIQLPTTDTAKFFRLRKK